jgi:hypothetical protein
MNERCRKPLANRLVRILIARGWQVRAAGPPKEEASRAWDFYRTGNMPVALNLEAEAVLGDFESRWRDSSWPPERKFIKRGAAEAFRV